MSFLILNWDTQVWADLTTFARYTDESPYFAGTGVFAGISVWVRVRASLSRVLYLSLARALSLSLARARALHMRACVWSSVFVQFARALGHVCRHAQMLLERPLRMLEHVHKSTSILPSCQTH